jgi:release factor glutamine methyltransferase
VNVTLALAQATARLTEAGIADAAWDAERLLRHVTGWDRAAVLLGGSQTLALEAQTAFFELVAERARRRPLQHLTGTQAFWRHEFLVTPDVLIPRPETELLVEASLQALAGTARPVIVDVGTGSGCVALSLAAERPDSIVHAIDISPAALAVARENARRLGLDDRVAFHQGDFLTPAPVAPGTAHLIVSNPPYVGLSEIPGLAPEVRDHEPRQALVPPDDRYGAYRRIAPQALPLLAPGGALVLEVGRGMAEAVVALCQAAGFRVRSVLDDLQGIPRTVVTGKD